MQINKFLCFLQRHTFSCFKYSKHFLRGISAYRRPNSRLATMKVDSPQFHAIFTPEVNALSDIFRKYGYELRMAGGAARDLLMNKQPDDIDFATTATPEEMKRMFTTEGIRMLHRKGEEHGTITIRLNDKQNFEITTLRIDMSTDGRHADVKFTTDWELDAGRRDLTFNAMFLGLDGMLFDYFNGREDLEKKCVRFVGDANFRIQEDYLRILRYFRFYGRIAVNSDHHEMETLEAIKKNVAGLNKISGERVWMELKKILSGNFAKEIMLKMIDLGISPYLGLPENPNTEEFISVCDRSQTMKPHPMTRLSALLETEDEALALHSRLRYSKYDRDLTAFIVAHRNLIGSPPLRPLMKLMFQSKSKMNDTHEWACEVLKYQGEVSLWKELCDWRVPKFPISGHILMEMGHKPGPKMNDIMTELKSQWIESDFKMTKEELLECIDRSVNDKQ